MCRLGLAAPLAACLTVAAAEPTPAANDAALEARTLRLSAQLRCLVCQNQSLAESNAEVALDLRREMLRLAAAGASDEAIVEFLVQRYGHFILYRPPFTPATTFLWVGPFALALVGAGGLLLVLRRRVSAPDPPSLTPDERHRAASVLTYDPAGKTPS